VYLHTNCTMYTHTSTTSFFASLCFSSLFHFHSSSFHIPHNFFSFRPLPFHLPHTFVSHNFFPFTPLSFHLLHLSISVIIFPPLHLSSSFIIIHFSSFFQFPFPFYYFILFPFVSLFSPSSLPSFSFPYIIPWPIGLPISSSYIHVVFLNLSLSSLNSSPLLIFPFFPSFYSLHSLLSFFSFALPLDLFPLSSFTPVNGRESGGTKRCRLSLLTNSVLVYESQCGGRRGVTGSQPMSTAVHIT